MSNKLTLQDCINFATFKGGKCLSEKYINCKTKMRWQCSHSHKWIATFDRITQGTWCPVCANNIKFTFKEVKNKVFKLGYKLLSTKYINNRTILKIECKCGYIWKVRLDDLINKGNNCPECNKEKMRSKFAFNFNFVQNKIHKLGGKLLSKKYKIKILIIGHGYLKEDCKYKIENNKKVRYCKSCNEILDK